MKRTGFNSMLDVVFALFKRELKTRFGSHKLGFIWVFLSPLYYSIPIFTIRYIVNGNLEDTLLMILTGLIPVLFVSNSIKQSGNAIAANINLFAFGVVKPFDVIFARVLLEFAIFLCSIPIFNLIFFFITGEFVSVESFLNIILLVLILFFFTLFISMIAGMVAGAYDFTNAFFEIITKIMYFSSGVLFLMRDIPQVIASFLLLNPVAGIFDFARIYVLPNYPNTEANIGYILIITLFLGSISMSIYMTLKEKVLIRR